MIAGEKAFKAKSHASLVADILEHEPPALSTVQAQCPDSLNTLCGSVSPRVPMIDGSPARRRDVQPQG